MSLAKRVRAKFPVPSFQSPVSEASSFSPEDTRRTLFEESGSKLGASGTGDWELETGSFESLTHRYGNDLLDHPLLAGGAVLDDGDRDADRRDADGDRVLGALAVVLAAPGAERVVLAPRRDGALEGRRLELGGRELV